MRTHDASRQGHTACSGSSTACSSTPERQNCPFFYNFVVVANAPDCGAHLYLCAVILFLRSRNVYVQSFWALFVCVFCSVVVFSGVCLRFVVYFEPLRCLPRPQLSYSSMRLRNVHDQYRFGPLPLAHCRFSPCANALFISSRTSVFLVCSYILFQEAEMFTFSSRLSPFRLRFVRLSFFSVR